MDATRCLCEEHDLILKVLDRFKTALEQARHNERIDRSTFEPFLDFFSGFTAGAHFCKEEHGLFPMLEDLGVPREGSPLAALEQEHEVVRALVRDFSVALKSADQEAESTLGELLDIGSRLIELLRSHIARADHCVFGLASGLLRDADPGEVEQVFSAAEAQAADAATLQRWRALAQELSASGTGHAAGPEAGGGIQRRVFPSALPGRRDRRRDGHQRRADDGC